MGKFWLQPSARRCEGQPLRKNTFVSWCKAHGWKYNVDIVVHGLRKNSVIGMLESGNSVAESAAVTGHSYAKAEMYARGISQPKMAAQAIERWAKNGTGTGKIIPILENGPRNARKTKG